MKLTDKQKEILLALVEGKEVQAYSDGSWHTVPTLSDITWFSDKDLRVKPETPKDIYVKEYKKYLPCLDDAYDEPNVEYTFDGVTYELKSVRFIDAKVNKDVSVLGEKANTDSKPQPDSEGWISNIGNDTWTPPDGFGIHSGTVVEYQFRNGSTFQKKVSNIYYECWKETDGSIEDIIKFRILKE